MQYEEKIFSVDKVAKILGVCKRTVQKYVKEGVLPCKKQGKKVWFSGADINEFMHNRNAE